MVFFLCVSAKLLRWKVFIRDVFLWAILDYVRHWNRVSKACRTSLVNYATTIPARMVVGAQTRTSLPLFNLHPLMSLSRSALIFTPCLSSIVLIHLTLKPPKLPPPILFLLKMRVHFYLLYSLSCTTIVILLWRCKMKKKNLLFILQLQFKLINI